jgi:NAD(P)-dependent dehydrogenase (short-subunit alcohol dehydrogenase family)
MTGKVAIITGASQGIGAGLVTGYRGRGWAVVATGSTITPSRDPGVLTVAGDIADPATAGQIVGAALERFGRLDTLVNNVGVFIAKPFTGYTAGSLDPRALQFVREWASLRSDEIMANRKRARRNKQLLAIEPLA